MSSYPVFKLIHLLGIFMILLSMGGLSLLGAVGAEQARWRKLVGMTHGIGLVLALVAGFALLASLQVDWPWPLWVWVKIGIWGAFGLATAVAGRLPGSRRSLWWAALLAAGTAAYMANFKPF